MALGPEDRVAAASDESAALTPRPLTRHFHFDELEVKESPATGEAQANVVVPLKVTESDVNPKEGNKELSEVLASRRFQVEADGQTFESKPEISTADASQLQGLTFDAPSVQEWLAEMETPEEDRTGELLAAGLRERGPRPAHAPPDEDCAQVERSRELIEAIAKLEQEVREMASSRSALEGECKKLVSRDAELQEAERKLKLEREEQQRQEKLRQDYPRPRWLLKSEGTMNVGVVGNSGVGKSLLINRLRGVPPGTVGWAPVGVNETTLAASMYAFLNERRVRLWDFPGVGTPMFPLGTYIARMGLRYLDSVIIVTAGRFTQTEVALKGELEQHSVPYFMVRTKADIDIWNNREDNGRDEAATLCEIAHDLIQQCGGRRPYIVSLRHPKAYDFPALLADAFPCLSPAQLSKSLGEGWDDPWVMPVALSAIASGIQGRWTDRRAVYYISGLEVHVTQDGRAARFRLTETAGKIWWAERWYLDARAVNQAHATGSLKWMQTDRRSKGMTWRWMD